MSRATEFGLIVVGSTPVFRAAYDVDGTPTDPTTVTFSWRIDDGEVTDWIYGTDAEVIKDSTGNYSVALPVTAPGRWYGRWVGTGDAAAAEELTFTAWTNFEVE